MESRTPETCPYRDQARPGEHGEIAICGLLKGLSGIGGHPGLQVAREACQACCDSYPPSHQDLNPIVASLLYGLTEQIVDEGGVIGCDVEQAVTLNRRAERSLPAVSPDEDDGVDIGRKSYDHLSTVTADQIATSLPRPQIRSKTRGGSSPAETNGHLPTWAVGVTTAPRRLPTLERSVRSVIDSGWSDPVLFVDGQVDLPMSLSSLRICRRSPAVGAFPNFFLSLGELFMRDPHADAYMMIQDDALFLGAAAMREYLQSVLWPGEEPWIEGPWIASLYCSKKYTQKSLGWHRFPGSWVWGAVALVFSPEAVRQFLASPLVYRHRALPDGKGLSRIDVLVGQVAVANQTPVLFPSPSLVQHIGTVSTIWNLARAVNARHANQFIGDLL